MHPTVRIFGAFLLAIALVSGGLYAADHWFNPVNRNRVENLKKTANAAPLPGNPASPAPAAAATSTTLAGSSTPPPSPPEYAQPSKPALAADPGAIAKCSVDGKIVYTDKGCPQGSKTKPLQITDNAVIPGLDQAAIEQSLRQPQPLARARAAPPAAVIEPEPVTSITTEPNVDCRALERRLDWLDYMAHRRHPPYIRDRMQRERDELQTRRFWAHC
ncbi:hypothetical protein [Collimonas sp.]|uniref:hypothetical protein n=1 Tax=Collimonas sp. TaxID=1963772 RepID=UPI002C334359|nr:hypothetical protein [Collimonas sp.]HWW05137.1 hypothetical protein [Collimonas sp.]